MLGLLQFAEDQNYFKLVGRYLGQRYQLFGQLRLPVSFTDWAPKALIMWKVFLLSYQPNARQLTYLVDFRLLLFITVQRSKSSPSKLNKVLFGHSTTQSTLQPIFLKKFSKF